MAQAARKKIGFTEDQKSAAREAFGDFLTFCEKKLKISDFQGKIVPFIPNRPQRRFLQAILRQWKDVGMIRVVIAKARKMGFSTVITAFIFWVLVTTAHKHALAGTHLESTNEVLVGIFNRFYREYPDKLKPTVGTNNASGMTFKNIDSSYQVQAASNVEKVGRGFTGQLLHVSEIAHIDNADQLPASLFSAVGSNVIDSMIFLESTANGTGNYHHDLYQKARRGDPGCEYIAFFAAWHEDERYQKDVPANFILSEEEENEKARYELTNRQMAWRRSMLSTMHGTEKQALAQFRQEYPSNEHEAFQYSKVDSFIEADNILDAMNRPQYGSYNQANVAIIAGYDPSHKGKDRDAFIYRQGANLWGLDCPTHFGEDFEARVAYLKTKLDAKAPYIDMLFIDAGAGYQIASRLHTDGYGDRVRRIEFGGGADNTLKYQTKRDEMFGDFNDLLIDKHNPLSISVSPELKDVFLQDLTATGYKFDHKGRPKMESKEVMKSRGIKSTDLTDASILTVAQKVVRTRKSVEARQNTTNRNKTPFRSQAQRR